MNINIFCYSDKGALLANKLLKYFENEEVNAFAIDKIANRNGLKGIASTSQKVAEVFKESHLMIFIGACGIAVRAISKHIESKEKDPAVIVIDDLGKNIIPILSGHIGGANDYALEIANFLKGSPIITTATDINDRFSVDSFARKNNLKISDMSKAKYISTEILTRDIGLKSDFEIGTALPKGVFWEQDQSKAEIYITYKNVQSNALKLVKKSIHIGIGCRKDTDFSMIESFFLDFLKENDIALEGVYDISSIDVKKNEPAILKLGEKYNLPLNFYSAEELNELKGDFTASSFVKKTVRTDNVCERSSVKASKNGKILIKKTSREGMTMACAIENWRVTFE